MLRDVHHLPLISLSQSIRLVLLVTSAIPPTEGRRIVVELNAILPAVEIDSTTDTPCKLTVSTCDII